MRIKLIPLLLILALTAGGVFAATKVGWISNNTTASPTQSRPSQSQAHKPAVPAAYDTSCASSKTIKERVPVLLVHGWNGRPLQWGNSKDMSGIYGALKGLPVLTTAFNYQDYNQAWVTHPAIGSALSQKINCLANASKAGGGKGKVIVVAHSMGGLATKRALALGGADRYVDRVFTLGTPYEGSGLGSIADEFTRSHCRRVDSHSSQCPPMAFEGLREFNPLIKALPDWPDHTGVMAMGGDVKTRFPEMDLGGDTFVSTSSALAGGQHPELGGGQLVYHCTGEALAPMDALCSHDNLPNYKPIQEQIKRSIQRYIDGLNGRTISYAGLTLQVPSSWKVTQRNTDSIRVESSQGCEPRRDETWCPWFMIYKLQGPALDYGDIPCENDAEASVQMQQVQVRVGGVVAKKTTLACPSDPPRFAFHLWDVPSRRVLVQGEDEGMLTDRLTNAHWN